MPKILNARYALVEKEPPRKGGMAEIHRAIDIEENGQSVAIKFFKADLDADRLHLEAYSRECTILQRLTHPNIVKILDGGTDSESGRRFLVLEWLERSLSQQLSSNRPAGWDSFYTDIGQPILGALSYAYGQNVIHRDLKPQNVLYAADGALRVADFGISKLTSLIAPGITVAGFRSEPYSPPEPDDGRFTETRDVYGFAVLTLACLSEKPLVSLGDVCKALEDFDGPPEVADVLEKALSREPDSRQPNIVALRRELEGVQSKREDHFVAAASRRRCHVRITTRAEGRMRDLLGETGIEPRQAIIADLNELCGIKRHESGHRTNGGTFDLALYAGQYLYHAMIDNDSKAHLVIYNVVPLQPSWLDAQRESAWMPKLQFLPLSGQPPPDAVGTVAWIVESVAEYETSLAEKRREARGEALFRTWNAILQAKGEVEQRRAAPILYEGVERDGNRLRLKTAEPLDDDLVDQPRLIEISEHVVIAGVVESVGAGNVVLWTEEEVSEDVPRRGRLILDTRAERHAINRQRQALDAIRFRRAARPELRDLLVEPEKVRPPSDPGRVEFVGGRLDESKQRAVTKALGTDSFLIVEGPPGTGKTRFITELVLQTLRRMPKARILLTSQTHVALDNALAQLRSVDPTMKLVRIGRRHDEKVSPEVSDLLLENRVESWLHLVQQRSERFLTGHAIELGVDAKEIALGMAAGRLHGALRALEELEKRKSAADQIAKQLEKQESERSPTGEGDTYHELKEALRESTETTKRLEFEHKRAEDRVKESRTTLAALSDFGVELSKLSANELQEWEQAFLEQNAQTRKMGRLIALAQEWFVRFGRSRDFFAALIADSQVIAGTCIGFGGVRGMNAIDFDLCIVDEASKAAVTELLVPLSRARRWILVGDRNQLPPFVEDALEDKSLLETHGLREEDLKHTLLESLADHLPADCVTRLQHQHRMVRQIGDLVNHCFYGDLISVREGDSGFLAPALPRPVTWFSTEKLATRWEKRDCASFKNLEEVRQICRILKHLNFMAQTKKTKLSVAVLSGYSSQREELRRALDADHQALESITIECNTVDAFQGREADVAIYSVTRCNDRGDIGFLRERRRLNVALSRARIGLAIVGDPGFLRSAQRENPWIRVLDYIESHPADCAMQDVAQ